MLPVCPLAVHFRQGHLDTKETATSMGFTYTLRSPLSAIGQSVTECDNEDPDYCTMRSPQLVNVVSINVNMLK